MALTMYRWLIHKMKLLIDVIEKVDKYEIHHIIQNLVINIHPNLTYLIYTILILPKKIQDLEMINTGEQSTTQHLILIYNKVKPIEADTAAMII